jgi:hypothetical protein
MTNSFLLAIAPLLIATAGMTAMAWALHRNVVQHKRAKHHAAE